MSTKSLSYTHHAAYSMAGLLGAGALYGALVKNSRASLLAGTVLAAGYGAAGWYAFNGEYLIANQLGALSGGVLTAAMGMRYLRTRSPVALILSTLGAASTTLHAVHWSQIEPIKIVKANASRKLDEITK